MSKGKHLPSRRREVRELRSELTAFMLWVPILIICDPETIYKVLLHWCSKDELTTGGWVSSAGALAPEVGKATKTAATNTRTKNGARTRIELERVRPRQLIALG